MKTTKSTFRSQAVAGAVLALFVFAGCGGPPADNPMLIDARMAYSNAATNVDVIRHAPVELEDAQQMLEQAEVLRIKKADKPLIDHHAYVAKQKSRIAVHTAKLAASDREVKRAEMDRKQVQLEARSAEAERSARIAEERTAEATIALRQAEVERMQAEKARNEAVKAREDADAAIARAKELTDKLADMEARQTERGLVLTLGDVLFDVGRSTLKSGSERAIDQLSTFMREYPERRVLIEGYTDNTGRESTNELLSQKRARAVRDAIVLRGISGSRIDTEGYGEAYPVASNSSESGRQANRRVEIVISDESGAVKGRY